MHTHRRTLLFIHALSSSSTPPSALISSTRVLPPHPVPALCLRSSPALESTSSPVGPPPTSTTYLSQIKCFVVLALDRNPTFLSPSTKITRIFPWPLCHAWPPQPRSISLWRAAKPNPWNLFLAPAFLFPSLSQPLHLCFNPFQKEKKKILKLLFELHLLYALISISMKHHVSSRNTHNPMVIDVNTDPFPIIDASSSNYSNLMPRNPIAPKNHAIHRQNLIEPNYLTAAPNPIASILRSPSLIHCRRKNLHRALTDLRLDPP